MYYDQEFLILFIFGFNDSGLDYWQICWECKCVNVYCVELGMWDDLYCNIWVNKFNLVIYCVDQLVVFVVYSFGCLMVVWWVEYEQLGFESNVIGVLLVVLFDVDRFGLDL